MLRELRYAQGHNYINLFCNCNAIAMAIAIAQMEFSCQYDVHFSSFFVLHRCILGSVLISVSWGSLLEIVGQIDIFFFFGERRVLQ